jgi:hypothetical protein
MLHVEYVCEANGRHSEHTMFYYCMKLYELMARHVLAQLDHQVRNSLCFSRGTHC